MKNNNRPSIEPRGTPVFTSVHEDVCPYRVTLCVLFFKKSFKKFLISFLIFIFRFLELLQVTFYQKVLILERRSSLWTGTKIPFFNSNVNKPVFKINSSSLERNTDLMNMLVIRV